jgi:adenylylsulfate kinase
MITWIIGLAGAGKTVIGKALFDELKPRYSNLIFLDGDMIRDSFGEDLGHTISDRKKNADRISRLCRVLDRQNIHVICSVLSLFHESQAWNRNNYKQYYEIYIDVSMEILIKRDQKKLYSKAQKGEIKNVVGIDIPFSPPVNPHMIIKNDTDRFDFTDIVKNIIFSMPNFI